MRVILFGILVILFASACQEESLNSGKSIQEIKAGNQNKFSEIIRNPVSADGSNDTINVAKMEFEEYSHNFGVVNEGDKARHVFKFKNTGKVALLIADARSTCGCTVPSYPKTPIAPGASGEIKVVFDTKSKAGKQSKPVSITANTYPKITTIYMNGTVETTPNQ